ILQGADIVRKLEDVAGGISNIYEIFGNKDSAKDQQNQFLDQIEKLMDSKQVIRLDMPYRVCENMVITEVQIVRDNTTDQAVSFKLSAQQILIAKTIYTDISALKKNPASGLNGKTDDVKDKGLNKVKDVSTSLATRIKEAAFGQ
uniref:phage baseplate protein n=1 Tax=Sulfurovum sp. TaxID=1969726 RepID=UPI0035660C5B